MGDTEKYEIFDFKLVDVFKNNLLLLFDWSCFEFFFLNVDVRCGIGLEVEV